MKDNDFFTNMLDKWNETHSVLDISYGGKVLVLSDLHMGSGKGDDLAENGDMLIDILKDYYFKNGWYLVLNGDIEDLHRYSLEQIYKKWKRMFDVFDLFAKEKRLYKIIGNHDEDLLYKKRYPYPLHTVIRIDTAYVSAFVYHGHQSSRVYVKYNKLLATGVRFILKPFGIKNISSARNPYRRFRVEKAAYKFSRKTGCLSIIGHTHRPLFESLGRFDYIKFEIEKFCRQYPEASEDDKKRIEAEVFALRKELGKLKRKERRDVLRQSLYGDVLPVPCLFNSGCAIGKKGPYAIELSSEDIALVYWFTEGKGRRFVSRGNYEIEACGSHRRAVLNKDRLDYILARIQLLG